MESYKEAVEKLRRIVAEIEQGDLDVDLLSDKVKEATRLIKLCKEKLYKADEEVKKVLIPIQMGEAEAQVICPNSSFRWRESRS